jgi:hypothetical protein
MRARLQELLEIDHIVGVMFISFQGDTLCEAFAPHAPTDVSSGEGWAQLVQSFAGIHEADLIFENKRFYLRKADSGYLLVIMETYAPAAMVRLSCDTIVPSLGNGDRIKTGRLKGLLKRFK